jgi:hypothetical protein
MVGYSLDQPSMHLINIVEEVNLLGEVLIDVY